MNSGVSLLAKTAFFNDVTITSSLRSVVQVLMGHFTIFQAHGLSGCFMPKIIKKLSKFVKVTAKILSVFFSTRCIYTPGECLTKITLDGWLQLCFMFLTKLQTDCCTCNNDKYTRKSPPDGRTQRHTHITHSVEIIDFCFEAPCLC